MKIKYLLMTNIYFQKFDLQKIYILAGSMAFLRVRYQKFDLSRFHCIIFIEVISVYNINQ